MANKNARQRPGANPIDRGQFSTFADVKQRARHQWQAILVGFGIDPAFLKNQHGPCPACGGKDRFRFDDKDGNGGYYCNGCGPGDGFRLLEKVHGWTAQEALQAVARWLGMVGVWPHGNALQEARSGGYSTLPGDHRANAGPHQDALGGSHPA